MKTLTLITALILTVTVSAGNEKNNHIVLDNEIIKMDQGGMAMDDLTDVGDYSAEGEELVVNVTPLVQPQNGSIEISEDGMYMYFPNESFVGKDTVSVEVCVKGDNTKCGTNHMYIIVEAPKKATAEQMNQIVAISNKK